MQNKYQNISRSYSKPTNKHQSNPLVKIVILAIVLLVGFWLWNTYASATTGVPTDSPKGLVQLVVNKGDNLSSVGDQLVKQKALNASWSLQWLAQSQEKWALQPGKYTVTTPAKPDEILKQLQKKSDELYKKSLSPSKQVVSLTFKEGETVDDIIKKLAEKDLSTTAELQKIAQDPTAFSRTAYPFLPVPLTCQYGNMTNCAKYYLEGFLYPDTYDFFTTATPKEIFGKLLDNFELKVWEKVKADVGNKDFQKIITMASVIEREIGRAHV